MLLDYHAHVNFSSYKDDADVVIARALDSKVHMVLVGSQIDTSRRAVAMAEKYPMGVYAAVGLHPVHLEDEEIDEEEVQFRTRKEEFDPATYQLLASHPKTVAIGETGIDYFHLTDVVKTKTETREIVALQHKTFRAHLALADQTDLPLIMHCRPSRGSTEDAYEDMLTILREEVAKGNLKRHGVIHCFLGTEKIAKEFVRLGFSVGFTGIITFPNAQDLRDVAKALPLDKILIETDCPYLTPVPHRGTRNEPAYVRYVAEEIARARGVSIDEVENVTFQNSLRLFHKIPS